MIRERGIKQVYVYHLEMRAAAAAANNDDDGDDDDDDDDDDVEVKLGHIKRRTGENAFSFP